MRRFRIASEIINARVHAPLFPLPLLVAELGQHFDQLVLPAVTVPCIRRRGNRASGAYAEQPIGQLELR